MAGLKGAIKTDVPESGTLSKWKNILKYKCFQEAFKLLNSYVEKNNLSRSIDVDTFRNAAQWMTRNAVGTCGGGNLLSLITEYDFITLTLFYCLIEKYEYYSGVLFNIILSIKEDKRSTLRSAIKENFRLSNDDLYVIVKSLCLQPDLVTADYRNELVGLLIDMCNANDLFTKACCEGALPVVSWLLESNLAIPREALHFATEEGHVKVVKALLENGAKYYLTNDEGHTPLYTAVRNGNLKIVKLLLKKSNNIHCKHLGNKTALHLASENGQCQIVEYLVQKGADILAKTKCGHTALHLAIMNDHESVASCLINYGSNVNEICNTSKTSLHYAVEKNLPSMVDFLLKRKDILKEAKTENGHSPLHLASIHGFMKVAEILLANGAYVNCQDNKRCTPCHLAATSGHDSICELLARAGADMELKDFHCWRPLHYAAMEGRKEVVEFLLTKISDVNCVTHSRKNALHLATENGHLDVVKLLLKADIDSKQFDISGYRAIHYAAKEGHLKVVEIMCDLGVEIDCWTNHNRRYISERKPLDLADDNGHQEVFALLADRLP